MNSKRVRDEECFLLDKVTITTINLHTQLHNSEFELGKNFKFSKNIDICQLDFF
jgi:hypothetical protein